MIGSKENQATEHDLRLLDEFRRSFSAAYEGVIETITKQLKLQPTGRPAKSTTSISEKLNRESIRLTQIQDIAGCRIIVSDIREQERVVSELIRVFASTKVVDRRASPSHGYRAVHVIVNADGTLIEIQVRTSLQHLWAECSEKVSDVVDPDIKYGSGDEKVRSTLINMSGIVAKIERFEQIPTVPPDIVNEIRSLRDNMIEIFRKLIRHAEQMPEAGHDISD